MTLWGVAPPRALESTWWWAACDTWFRTSTISSFKVQKACSVAHALKHHVRFQGQVASDRTFWVRASVERASRESVAFPLEPAPGSRSRAPRVPTADDPPTTRLASFIRRDPVVPPRSPSRPPPLNLAQDAELAAGRVAVADGPMRARLPVGGDIPAEWWRVPATLDLVVAADDWRLRVTRHVHEPAVASAEPEILHEDDRLVFVDKPAGVPSCAAGVGPGLPGENNCVALLNRETKPPRRANAAASKNPSPSQRSRTSSSR